MNIQKPNDDTDPKFWGIVKSGIPQKLWERLLAFNYLWVVLLEVVVSIVFIRRYLSGGLFRYKVFLLVFAFSMPMTFLWGAVMVHVDPAYKGWGALSFHTLGSFKYWSYEDILFYPASCVLFYTVYRLIAVRFSKKDFAFGDLYKILFWIGMCNLGSFFLYFGHLCGKSLTCMYMIPALLMNLYVFREYRFKSFLFFFCCGVGFEMVWDWAFVSWIHMIPGLEWATGWFYGSWGADGIWHYSHKVFMAYPTYWIFENPVEITPYYGIVGSYFAYMTILSCDTFLKRLGHGKQVVALSSEL